MSNVLIMYSTYQSLLFLFMFDKYFVRKGIIKKPVSSGKI
jgi:hypothetical protein